MITLLLLSTIFLTSSTDVANGYYHQISLPSVSSSSMISGDYHPVEFLHSAAAAASGGQPTEESIQMVECVPPQYFLCRNNNCLPESHVCDGENDCGDHSDEDVEFCAKIRCNATVEFKCSSGRCVPKAARCDRIAQCRDRSDEADCGKCGSPVLPVNDDFSATPVYEPCPADRFSCANHSQCLDMSEVCDGSVDCKDGLASDERHPDPCTPNVTCPAYAFKCHGTNVCALPNWMCDGEDDCGDGSDENEENCHGFRCPDGWFRCRDHRCISINHVCNGIIDCKDGHASDERHPDPCPKNVTCPPDFFSCEETNICAHPHWLCDGADDCGDRSDEDIEKCAKTPCPDDWFRCSHTKRCIPPNWRCDGTDDCMKGEDETGCNIPDYVQSVFIPENNTWVSYVNYTGTAEATGSMGPPANHRTNTIEGYQHKASDSQAPPPKSAISGASNRKTAQSPK